jgi:hypothetical protein
MANKEKLIETACALIAQSLGQGIASQYRIFYKDKKEKEIKSSIRELLEELYGPHNAIKKYNQAFKSAN